MGMVAACLGMGCDCVFVLQSKAAVHLRLSAAFDLDVAVQGVVAHIQHLTGGARLHCCFQASWRNQVWEAHPLQPQVQEEEEEGQEKEG